MYKITHEARITSISRDEILTAEHDEELVFRK